MWGTFFGSQRLKQQLSDGFELGTFFEEKKKYQTKSFLSLLSAAPCYAKVLHSILSVADVLCIKYFDFHRSVASGVSY